MKGSGPDEVHGTVERVARDSYGRLVAYLSSCTRDVAGAEDALSEALITALRLWPRDGVPRNPEAWLLTTARHALIDHARHERVVLESEPTLLLHLAEAAERTQVSRFPDERLKLLFVCAHPAIDPAMHTPLMLQAVLGLDAARIAGAFLISAKTMGQRLVRAKTKIRAAGIQFEIPEANELPQRLDAVLEAIYAAFGIGWDDMAGADQRPCDLAGEAVWLGRVLLQLIPDEAEVHGMMALMLHCMARRAARRGPEGEYVPLSEQDPRQWSISLIAEAERHLSEAARHGRPGRFQLEAAIQSVHAEQAHGGRIEWVAITKFYEQLIRVSPTLGTGTGYAAAIAELKGPEAGLAVLDAMDVDKACRYQPYWAVRAYLLRESWKTEESAEAYERAISLAEDPAVREFLRRQRLLVSSSRS